MSTASSNACRAASAPITPRATSRRSMAISCSTSTGPIISTRRATAPRRRRSPAGRSELMLRPGASRDAKRKRRERAVFELERFIEECRAAVRADPTHRATREVVARAVSDPAGVLAGLGEPRRAEVQKLYHAPDLTILNVVWGPGMTVRPHNHLMWAVIGIYTGRENNIWWRRLPADAGARIEAAGAKSLGERETEPLGRDIIHTVTNPLDRRDPCLWRRFLCDAAQRMGPRDARR